MLSIFRKLLNILRSIKLRILITMIYKVISDVVSLPKLIAGDDPLVNSVSDGLITVILVAMRSQLDLVRSYRQTEVEMHVTLLLADTHNNTVHILGARLDIFLSPGNQDLTSLADIAWLIFIRDAERNDVQLGKILFERFRAAHIQHLQQALLRSVDSVFCAALPLCQPDRRFTGSDGLADVFRQNLRGQIEFPCRNPADHPDHPVGTEQIFNGLALLDEVVTDTDLRHRDAVPEKHLLGDGRIKDDVPVIGHRKEFSFDLLDITDAVIGEVVDCVIHNPGHSLVHHNFLELIDIMHTLQCVPKEKDRLVREKIFGNSQHSGMIRDLVQGLDRLSIVVRTDAFEFR